MKRIEVKLSLPVVAPLLDVIRELAEGLRQNLAAPPALTDLDEEFRAAWAGELLSAQTDDVQTLLALMVQHRRRTFANLVNSENARREAEAEGQEQLHLKA